MKLKPFITSLLALLMILPESGKASERIDLTSMAGHRGIAPWRMARVSDVSVSADSLSGTGFSSEGWLEAVVPGTVLNSLVYNKVYPEPYYGLNNKIESGIIPDISAVGRDFYTYWFRTEFEVPVTFRDKTVWLRADGINYRAELWLNGHLVGSTKGMFMRNDIDVTDYVTPGARNVLAVKVLAVDMPGSTSPKTWGAPGEFRNGGNGDIGLNTTMLMSVGWDFTFMDGIRDRNTGIWRDISLYTTGKIALRNPFVRSEFAKPAYDKATETVSVEVVNPTSGYKPIKCTVSGEIEGTGIRFEKTLSVQRGEEKEVTFDGLTIDNPRLWWPVNKGPQNLYTLNMKVCVDGVVSDSLSTRFGIREITSDRNTPDKSRQFYVNGHPLFIRGSNWIPEAMLRNSDRRTEAELRYTRQSGINLLRMWGGGIAESDRFFELCDSLGILVWQEFWLTGDTKHPVDRANYLDNVASVVKRLRNHPSLAYYVASNESSEVTGTPEIINRLDGTRGYQMQSECAGVHDGSPYKQVNPMQHYENTASPRGSRVDGFNPEYGAPTFPTAETAREMMDMADLWPMNQEVWDYHDGNGFHLMSTMYTDMVNQYGKPETLEDYAAKAQLVGAMNSKSIWEVWNYNKLGYGDRYCSGLLFWYHNCPVPQVASRMWDWSLEPTASLYHTANALEPVHPQFDYLKNTVSVANDYYSPVEGHTLSVKVYDINSRKVFERTAKVDIPADGVANDLVTIDFPAGITPVHFISMEVRDAAGRKVGSNFYWRSNDKYEGANTVTGPCVSGFESLQSMPRAAVKSSVRMRRDNSDIFFDVTLRNTTSKIAFFNRIQLTGSDGRPVRPSFYTDNYFTLLPGESRTVTIETAADSAPENLDVTVSGWNTSSKTYHFTNRSVVASLPRHQSWVLGPFVRPAGVNPVIEPSDAEFDCPMTGQRVRWEESDVFNPAAVLAGNRVAVLYRAEDNSATGIGKRTSRIGLATGVNGVKMNRAGAPVLFPGGDDFTDIDCPGGCEDPRVAVTDDGTYVMLYTSWNRRTPRLSVATSRDLKHWTKHGPAFAKAYDGRFAKIATKSASILTALKDGRLVIDKVDGRYFMYWGEYAVHAATSDNLVDWTPVVDSKGDLLKLATPRRGRFDSQMTECGPPAVRTPEGIVLIYNGKNDPKRGDRRYPSGAYCAGQMLFDTENPLMLKARLDEPFFKPEAPFEKSGQYRDGTVFTEGLVYKDGKLYLYYGCADSRVAVAIAE